MDWGSGWPYKNNCNLKIADRLLLNFDSFHAALPAKVMSKAEWLQALNGSTKFQIYTKVFVLLKFTEHWSTFSNIPVIA